MQTAYDIAAHSPVLSVLLAAATLAFIGGFLAPALRLGPKLSHLAREIRALKETKQADPRQITVRDRRLGSLWQQFVETLHLPNAEINPRTGIAQSARYRATVPAEVVFNAQSVYEGRIHSEFFKHLPGLLTGLGIIGTFAGLIQGLGSATAGGAQLDTGLLIASVKEAFYVSASAIALAMIITFIEKLLVARLHRGVEQLCQHLDAVWSLGAGEEYLSRLVHASEESASQARILKDALVGELGAILERLTQRQIEAAATQQASLESHLITAIDQGLRQPLGELVQGFGQFRQQQGQELAHSLQDSMAAFADKLDQMLGGRVGHAKDLQRETLLAIEKAVAAFQVMAAEIARAGTAATATMSSELDKAITDVAASQEQMTATMRAFVDELRRAVIEAQADASSGVAQLLNELGEEVRRTLRLVTEQSSSATATHRSQVEALSASTEATIASLAENVRNQTHAIEQATSAMRGAVSEIESSVDRNVTMMGQGADRMRQAAEQFTISGTAIADVFERARNVSVDLNETAARLSGTSRDIEAVIGDYRTARETFAGIVDGLKSTVDTAKREVAMTSDLVARLEMAAQKLIAAQGHADEYLAKLNAVLAEAHASFSDQMLATVRKTNGEFHDSLRRATGLLANTISEFETALGDNTPHTRGRAQ